MNKYLSIITNFGCHYTCPYCIVKNNNIDIPKTTVAGLDKLVENIDKFDCNWVSISGGGDPLHNFNANRCWWEELFRIVPGDIRLELHTSYIGLDWWGMVNFDRIVYHCRSIKDLYRVSRCRLNQTIRVVFVVTEDFTPKMIDDIATVVKHHPHIDELSFRQMVDGNYNTTHYCEDYLKAGHQKDWWYIEQNDYNIYYVENEVSFKYEDFKKEQTMQQDYTINDALHDGFESGLLYVLRYVEDVIGYHFSDTDVARLASHLEARKSWKSDEDWEVLIHKNIGRFK